MTAIGWCFLRFFEELSWVVLVALIVPWVDSYSVWRGPTKTIVTQKPEVFSALSFTFPVPGQDGGAKLGLPTCSSSHSTSAPARASGYAPSGRGLV